MKFEKDLVSVITPVYNCEKYIEDAIKSVLGQSYKNWEMILVDDLSTDKSCEIIERYIKNDSRIKLVKLKKNSGAAIARNTAMELAKGRFLAFLDGDDIWVSNKLELQIDLMKKHKSGISHSDYEVIAENGESLNKIVKVPKNMTYDQYLRNTIIQTVTVVIDREITGKVSMPNIKMRQDFATWLSILKKGNNALGINQTLGKYRRVSNSLSSNKFKAMRKNWYVYRRIEKLNIFKASYCFLGYAFNATLKRVG